MNGVTKSGTGNIVLSLGRVVVTVKRMGSELLRQFSCSVITGDSISVFTVTD